MSIQVPVSNLNNSLIQKLNQDLHVKPIQKESSSFFQNFASKPAKSIEIFDTERTNKIT